MQGYRILVGVTMSRENMFLKAWEDKTTPLIKTIEDNTVAYTKAVDQQARDRINETIKRADANLTDLYQQFEQAYTLIFPNRTVAQPQPAPQPESVVQGEFAPFDPAPNAPVIFRAEGRHVESEQTEPRATTDHGQILADLARKDQLISLLNDIPNRYARTRSDDPAYEKISADRLRWTTELNELERRLDAGDGGDRAPAEGTAPTQVEAEASSGRKGVRLPFLLLAILCVGLVFGGGYLLSRNNRPEAKQPDPVEPETTAADIAFYMTELNIAQPAYYVTGSLKPGYSDYSDWAQDAGILSLFDQDEHQVIQESFFALSILDKDEETVAKNTAKFFWAADFYLDLKENLYDYRALQWGDSEFMQNIYYDVSYGSNAGEVVSAIVDQYDTARLIIDELLQGNSAA